MIAVVEDGFKSLEYAQVFPIWGFSVSRGINGVEIIVINKVVLGRHVTSLEIANESNVFGMNRRDANALSTA